MEIVLERLLPFGVALLWPFCRIFAAFATAPVLGEAMVPMRARALAALLLALVVQPALPPMPAVDPFSFSGIGIVAEQILIGGLLGFVLHLVLAAMLMFGTLLSSQMGLSMAAINDPVSGHASDVLSSVMMIVFMLLFFSMDGHLVLVQVLARSFAAWPVGAFAFDTDALMQLVFAIGWMFSAALALALPVVFATLVVQVGLGLLNRAAPSLNLFSLGFSVTTMFGLLLVTLLMPSLPDHYGRMIAHALDLVDRLAPAAGAAR
ncbi:flagellar biosynthetic protein FliR [Burkholderia sp. Ac-20379]|uniref:flagellar biosynthetic protein FliR n=1 Tax=Burkholderia sp. Ac-20379 TaxID=2703900 RepID=UPI0019805E9C|nr:flagellar biosynthetic protein FliR [Burkholderia sp. Ac-20379]MBN3727021.1 flagellar biosynthetic protein FliR [Burkholderia sp. Ac-20379]